MGLIAHYRLDGNADDAFGKFNGVASDVTWVTGKLKQAASFNGSTSYIDSKIGPEIFRSDISICMWANFTDDSLGILFGNYNNVGGFAVEKHTSNRLRIWFNGSLDYYTPNNVVTTGNWHHLAFVRDTKANQWRIYVDGALVGSYGSAGTWTLAGMSTMWIGRDIRTGTTTTYGSLDDVRIYDHALSVREVRDLAMGLAVHYPMMDFQEPTENLYPMPAVEGNYFTRAFNGQYNYGVNTNAQWVVDNSDQPVAGVSVQKVSRIESGVSQFLYLDWGSFFPAKSLAPGQIVTISFWYYGTYGTSIMPYIGGGTGGVVFAGSGWRGQVITVPVGQWHRVSFTLTNPTLETKTYDYGWMRLHYNTETVALSNQEFWKFTAVQTESKPYPTEYTQGVRSARVVDTSGQGADAPLVLATTPKWIEESPTGRGAYDFSAPNHCVAIPDTKENYHDGFTLACWAYKRGSGGANVGRLLDKSTTTSASGGFFLYNNGSQLAFGLANGSAPLACAIPTAQWFHVVVTVDTAGNARIYLDGELTHQAAVPAPSQILTSNPLTIGNRSTASDSHWDGLVSDFRFYSASITAEQVKELYQQRASLDSQGNLYAQLINERNVTKLQVTKAGQLSSQVSEVGITDGLVAYYPLNKDAQDYSGNGLHGVANGATAVGGGFDGKGAYTFDGVDDYIRATGTGINAGSWAYPEATFLFWIRPKRPLSADDQNLVTVENTFEIAINNWGPASTLKYASTPWAWRTAPGSPVVTGEWTMIAYTHSTTARKLFVNGVEVYVSAETGGLAAGISAYPYMTIGGRYSGPSSPYIGDLSALKIFNRALTAQEIAVEYKRTGPTKMTQRQGVTYIQGEFKEV